MIVSENGAKCVETKRLVLILPASVVKAVRLYYNLQI